MDRYLTHSFVALSWAEAIRLAQLEALPLADIYQTRDVVLLHRTDWWAWWSDGILTMSLGLPESLRPQGLSPDAVELITDVWASDSPTPACGWRALAQVKQILRREILSMGQQRGGYQTETQERLTVALQTGELSMLYRLWQEFDEAYLCEVSFDLPAVDN